MKKIVKKQSITYRNSHSIDLYLAEISRYSLLTTEEEVSLARKIKEGDGQAKEKMINSNLRFVVKVANQMKHPNDDLEDLINVGNIGLIKAVPRFDPTKGFRFISYAVWWIQQAIATFQTSEAHFVRKPSNIIKDLRKMSRAEIFLQQELRREPTVEEIANAAGYTFEETAFLREQSVRPFSLEQPRKDTHDAHTFLDKIPQDLFDAPDMELHQSSTQIAVQRIIESLRDWRDQYIITHYFGIGGKTPMTLEEIGKDMNLTKEMVRKKKEKVFATILSSPKRKELLQSCLAA